MVGKAAVLGAGTMGAQIAAHIANAGSRVLLLDLTDEQSRQGLKAIQRASPAALFLPQTLGQIETGSFDRDLARIREADWVLEAVIEDAAIKKQLLEKVDASRRPGTWITTNTSGL